MAIQKTIDKTANKVSTTYTKGIKEIVEVLLDNKKDLTNEEFASSIKSLDMKSIVSSKLSEIKKEYVVAHVEVLKDIKPPVK